MNYLFSLLLLAMALFPGCTWFEKEVKETLISLEKEKPHAQEFFKDQFLKAAARGDLQEVTRQLESGTPVNMQDKDVDEMTALMVAAHQGHLDVVKTLLAAGADVDMKNKQGMTALMFAAQAGHTEVMDELLRHGADIAAREKDVWTEGTPPGRSALMFAITHNRPHAVKMLIEKGTPKELLNELYRIGDGYLTPLMFAAQHGLQKIVDLLLPAGIDIKRVNDEGKSALLYAARGTGILTEPWGYIEYSIPGKITVDIMKKLIQRGADIMHTDKKGMNALHMAAQGVNEEGVHYILQQASKKMPKNEFLALKTKDGKTALDLAQEKLEDNKAYSADAKDPKTLERLEKENKILEKIIPLLQK